MEDGCDSGDVSEGPDQDDDAMLVGDMELNEAGGDAAASGDQAMTELAVARILVDTQVCNE